MAEFFYQWYNTSLLLNVYVQPKASCNEIVGLQGNYLKVRLTSPATDNKANEQLIAFLAEKLAAKSKKITIISGQRSRYKKISIEDADFSQLISYSGAGEIYE